MGMAAVIYKKGAPDNFVWEKIKVGSPERGQVRSSSVGASQLDMTSLQPTISPSSSWH